MNREVVHLRWASPAPFSHNGLAVHFRAHRESGKYGDSNWTPENQTTLSLCQLDIATVGTFTLISIWFRKINIFKLSRVNMSRRSEVSLTSLSSTINKISPVARPIDSSWLQDTVKTRTNSVCEEFSIVSLRCISEDHLHDSKKSSHLSSRSQYTKFGSFSTNPELLENTMALRL